jgi:hypothetical protein
MRVALGTSQWDFEPRPHALSPFDGAHGVLSPFDGAHGVLSPFDGAHGVLTGLKVAREGGDK